jgi:hypothetical protein
VAVEGALITVTTTVVGGGDRDSKLQQLAIVRALVAAANDASRTPQRWLLWGYVVQPAMS